MKKVLIFNLLYDQFNRLIEMDEIIELLKSSFVIDRVILNNFTVLDESLNIEVDMISAEYGCRKIYFSDVTKLDIDSRYYGCSPHSTIIIEDVSELHWEDVFYKVTILEDVMMFYCKTIYMK